MTGVKTSELTDLKAIRRDLNILLDLQTNPATLEKLRNGKTLDDLKRAEAARLTIETGDSSYIYDYAAETVERGSTYSGISI